MKESINYFKFVGFIGLRKVLFCIILLCINYSIVKASPGDLDPTFNGTGIVTAMIGVDTAEPFRSVAVQSDGKIVAVGITSDTRSRFTIFRFLPDGSPDTSFDEDGKVVTEVGGGTANSYAFAVAIQTDGKILVSGYFDCGGSCSTVVRYNSDGSLDGNFGSGGIVQGSDGFSNSLAVQSDGKIIIGGYFFQSSTKNDFLIQRFNSNGTPDISFDSDGRVITAVSNENDSVQSVTVQTDGKIVVTGSAGVTSTTSDIITARYNANGLLDTSFDGDGLAITSISVTGREFGRSVIIQPDGKIIVGGRSGSTSNPTLLRFNSTGSLDTGFDNDGIVVFPGEGDLYSVKLQTDDKIVAGGWIGTFPGDYGVLRYNANGTPDTSFGSNGVVTTPIGSDHDLITSIAIQPNGKIVGLGNFKNGKNWDLALARYLSAPIKAPFDFDGDGKTDISIFRPGPNPAQYWLLRSTDGGNNAYSFGLGSDKPVPADYTGDGKTDLAFFRPSTSEWFILRSEDSTFYGFPFGASGDIPAPGDFDGDGVGDQAVYRPSTSTWFINNSGGGTTITTFGIAEDKPVVADYDGDGKDDIAIYRPSVSQWWLNRSTDGVKVYQFGTSGDKTVQGDFTGDGKADVAFWRPSSSEWFVIRSDDDSFYSFPFGAGGDIPTAGDYDGDGTFDAAIFRPSTTTWFINGSTSGTQIFGFGINSDVPLANVYSVE